MLKKAKITAAVLASAVLSIGTAMANPYDAYKGESLVISFPAHPHFDAVKKVLPKFTEETGIKVDVDQLQYLAMRQKQTLELSKPKGDYDLLAYVVFSKADYVAADQIYPLAPFFMNAKLADPNYEPGDLVTGYMENIGVAGGKKGYLPGTTGALYGVPFGAETSVLAYREDIFKKHGLEVPQTYEELVDVACKIPQLEPGMAGFTTRGASGHQISHAFLLHLAPLGGRIFDDHWKPVFNSPEGIKAAETLKNLMSCSPEGVGAFGFGEMKNAFLQGRSAMYLDSTVVAGEVDNPEKSKVVGKVAWAPHPKGVRRGSQTGGFGLAIPRNGRNPEASFLLLQWLTSKRVDKMIALEGGNPSRFSSHDDPSVNEARPYMKTFGVALQDADPDWRPIIPVWGEINQMLGTELSKSMSGDKSIKAALDGLVEPVTNIMLKAGYYSWEASR